MKTIGKISFIAVFSTLLLLSVGCSSKSQSKEEGCCKKEGCCKEAKPACQLDENALMIVATLTVKNEADIADLEAALHQVVDGTRTEEGNISYVLHQDINNPMTYIIFEVWKSQEAINAHNETEHFNAFKEAVGDKADLSVHTMKKVY